VILNCFIAFKRTQVVGSERDAISCVHGRFICIDSELQTGFFYNARPQQCKVFDAESIILKHEEVSVLWRHEDQ